MARATNPRSSATLRMRSPLRASWASVAASTIRIVRRGGRVGVAVGEGRVKPAEKDAFIHTLANAADFGAGGLWHGDTKRHGFDAWWPYVENGSVEAIVMTASGCGAHVKEYGDLLKHGIIGGFPLARFYSNMKNCMLICATETKTKEDLDKFANLLGKH